MTVSFLQGLKYVHVVSEDISDTANHVTPTDLFLFERWDESLSESIESQRSRLFLEYVALGHQGRLPYYEMSRNGTNLTPTLSQVDNILRRVRTPWERRVAARLSGSMIVLQTHYDADFEEIDDGSIIMITGTSFNQNPRNPAPMLNDADRYKYGDDWQRVLTQFPEIVDCRRSPETREAKEARLEEIKSWILDPGRDHDPNLAEQYNSVTGTIILRDELSDRRLPAGVESVQDCLHWERGNLLYMWLDEYGKRVRGLRCSLSTATIITVIIMNVRYDEEYDYFDRVAVV